MVQAAANGVCHPLSAPDVEAIGRVVIRLAKMGARIHTAGDPRPAPLDDSFLTGGPE
jgi:hypothetical protein